MAKAGDRLERPNGERLTFRKTAADTNGELLEVEVVYAPESRLPPPHYHPYQEERFQVLSGEIRAIVGKEERTYRAGEGFTVPRGLAHRMHNVSDEEARVIWQVCPALRTEDFFEAMWTLPEEKRNLFSLAAIIRTFSNEFRLNRPPYLVQRLLFGLLAPLGSRQIGEVNDDRSWKDR
jgi:quercetin dioxygenase-like cupin family protein